MGQPYVGQVIAVGFNFAPVNWLLCNGQLLPISEYEVLFTLIGTTYGGNGTTTFGLPDLRGRSPVDAGQGLGLSNYVMGQMSGSESVTLNANQVGAHTHALRVSALPASSSVPANTLVMAQAQAQAVNLFAPPPPTTALAGSAIGSTPPGNQPHENRQPFNTVNYIICAFGIFPSQS
jgi:microcystin-dependent protein